MTTYIGIDIGKKSLQLYLPSVDKSVSINNDKSGYTKLVYYLNKYYAQQLSDLIIVFEPTGGYEQHLRIFLKKNNINFTTVHPNKVRNYAKARGWLAKTDKIDSKLLHDYATVFVLPVKIDYDSENQQKLHSLIKRREQLILFRNQEIARLDKEIGLDVEQSLNQHLSFLNQQITNIEGLINDFCNNDIEIKNKVERLTSIPGVGITLATAIVCEAPELGSIEFSQLTSLIGLAPYARSSGQYNGKRRIFAGRGGLRRVLYMASVASLRCNKKLKTFYDRLISNHKPAKVALVAVMRKLLAFMNALVRNNSFWSDNLS